MINFEKPIGVNAKKIHTDNLQNLKVQNRSQAEIIERLSAITKKQADNVADFVITKKMRYDADQHRLSHLKDAPPIEE